MTGFLSRIALAVTAVVVLAVAVAVTVLSAEPAGGQAGGAFACDGGLYLTTGTPTDMALTRVDQGTGALTPIGPGGLVANAIAYDQETDHLYGMARDDPHGIVRISSGGTEAALGPAAGTPASWELTFVGTFLGNGHYLVLGDNASPPTPRGTVPGTWAEIDVTMTPPHVVRTFSHPSVGNNDLQDVAFNPADGQLYAHSSVHQRIVRIDATTGAATPVGPTFAAPANAGSSYFDSFGRLWLYGSGDAPGTQDTLYRIDDVTTDAPQVVGNGPAVTNSDGASCPFTVGMEKLVDPASVCAGSTVTYRYVITNQAHQQAGQENSANVQADFLDELPDDGRTFVAGSLVNPFGGTEQPYAGTRRLQIDDLWLPAEGTDEIRVQVRVPEGTPPGTLTNQAVLTGLSGNLGPGVRSEYPATPELPDATPLQVRSCPDLGIEKSVGATAAGPGDRLTYTIRVTNHGPGDALGVDSVADSLPPGLRFVSAGDGGSVSADGTVRWPAFDLAEGATRTFTVEAEVDRSVLTDTADDGDLDNTASVQHPDDPNPANDTDTAEVPVGRPDIVVLKDDGLTLVAPGDELTYLITVRNAGPSLADDVQLTDQLPSELEYVEGSDEAAYEEPASVVWPAFDLAPGEEREMTVTARVADDTPAGTEVRNVATAPHPHDLNPADNEDDDLDDVDDEAAPPSTTSPPSDPEPDPDPDPPVVPFLPRTGFGAIGMISAGLLLIVVGGTAWWFGRPRPT